MSSILLSNVANFGIGTILGAAGGLLGIGGGLIAIPVLAYLYGMDQHLAQGTALVMIAPNVLMGFYRYHQRHNIDLRAVLSISIFAMTASYVAARFANKISAGTLHVAFAVFLLMLAAYFGYERKQASNSAEQATERPHVAIPRAALPLLGIVSGAMSGIFTIGGGLVVVPALVSLFGMKQTRAQGMALALVAPGALISLVAYAQDQHVNWSVGIPMAFGGILSVSWGVKLAHHYSPTRLRLLFCTVLVGTAFTMLISPR